MFLCNLGFHKWNFKKKVVTGIEITTRHCIRCEKIEIGLCYFGYKTEFRTEKEWNRLIGRGENERF